MRFASGQFCVSRKGAATQPARPDCSNSSKPAATTKCPEDNLDTFGLVGMGGRLHEHGCAPELAQDQTQRDGAILEIDGTHAQLRVQLVVSGFSRT